MYRKASIILALFTACSLFQQEEQAIVSVAETDKGKEAIALGVELTDKREEISDEDAPLVLVQCVNEYGYKFKEPKNFLDLYTTVASYFETLTTQEQDELWSKIEDCALEYNLWGVADENQFEDPVQTAKELDRALFIASCFRESGYSKVPDPNYFNRDVNLDAYTTEEWDFSEDDPIVKTWQACEDKLPEELKNDEWDV
ncbi:MAG: hypothetical protein H8D44_05755 [Actinobacteria bacterium]|jgi:hypothetical protein|nr:hypothetical protein [Actinomycetota bacterium]MDB4823508.1 hypothetical protein [Acidimicrobiia bacterium]